MDVSAGRALKRALIFLLCGFVEVSSVRGQTVTGSLFGALTDASGGRLPGVSVTATSRQLISGEEVRVTGDHGTYRFPALPPGIYTVVFELPGFQTVRRENIPLLAGQSLALDIQLTLGPLEEAVTVSGEVPLVDVRSSALVNVATSAALENIPLERELTKLVNILPGVTDGRYDFAPVNNVHGGSIRQNLYSLDGVNTDDPVHTTTVTLLPVDAFQEVQVTTAGISAEFGDASGAVFNYITKSGGNEFRGGANLYYQGEKTQSDNLSEEVQQAGLTSPGGFDHIYDAGMLLGGPIQRNRVWFFTNLRYLDIDERRSDFRAPLATDDVQLFAKGTFQVAEGHKGDLSFYYRDYLNFPFTAQASFRNSDDARTWRGVDKTNYIVNPRWTSVINPQTLFEARASFSIFQLLATNPNNDGSAAYVDLATGIVSGGSPAGAGDSRRNRHEFKADLTHFTERWLGGNHNLKTGFTWGYTPVWQERLFEGARGPNALAGCAERCLSDLPDTQHLLFNGQPFRVRLYNTPQLQRFEYRTWAFYLQDQWVLKDRVTLNLGFRVDHETGSLIESQGGGGGWTPEVTVYPEQSGLIDIIDVAPRLGFVWDLTANHRRVIKASAGRYYNQLGSIYLQRVSPAEIGFLELDWVDTDGDRLFDIDEGGTVRLDTRPNLKMLPTIDSNLNNQFTDVYTVGFEQVLTPSLSLAATGIFKRDGDLLGLTNAAVPFSSYQRITVVNPLDGQPLEIFTLPSEFQGLPSQLVVTNPGERPGDTEKLERSYDGLEIVLRKRLQNRWQMETSYVLARGVGNVSNTFGRSDHAAYTNPNLLINALGDLDTVPRHQFKIYGTYLAPYGLSISGYFEALSGVPLTDDFSFGTPVKGARAIRFFKSDWPQILSETFIDVAGEPAGTIEFDSQTRLDLRIEKRFSIKNSVLSVVADVFNGFNSGAVVRVQDLRLDSPRFGLPAQLQLPRQLRLGLKWTF